MEKNNKDRQQQTLSTTRLIWMIVLTTPILAIVVCHYSHAAFSDLGATLPIVGLRTIFYSIAILLFPLVRLYRHRPLIRSTDTTVEPLELSQRFIHRVIVCLITAEVILGLGLLLCLLGDDLASFYLLTSLSLLSIIMYRPQVIELKEFDT